MTKLKEAILGVLAGHDGLTFQELVSRLETYAVALPLSELLKAGSVLTERQDGGVVMIYKIRGALDQGPGDCQSRQLFLANKNEASA